MRRASLPIRQQVGWRARPRAGPSPVCAAFPCPACAFYVGFCAHAAMSPLPREQPPPASQDQRPRLQWGPGEDFSPRGCPARPGSSLRRRSNGQAARARQALTSSRHEARNRAPCLQPRPQRRSERPCPAGCGQLPWPPPPGWRGGSQHLPVPAAARAQRRVPPSRRSKRRPRRPAVPLAPPWRHPSACALQGRPNPRLPRRPGPRMRWRRPARPAMAHCRSLAPERRRHPPAMATSGTPRRARHIWPYTGRAQPVPAWSQRRYGARQWAGSCELPRRCDSQARVRQTPRPARAASRPRCHHQPLRHLAPRLAPAGASRCPCGAGLSKRCRSHCRCEHHRRARPPRAPTKSLRRQQPARRPFRHGIRWTGKGRGRAATPR
mmetsp:Transcript_23225/g.87936  ORF Transcript_23225/g.87936 Transcript_23225/m.87936 type:complete len:380 (+) Transcript_23225:1260-2399(+)